MNRVKLLSATVVIATTASIFLLLPGAVRLKVGDSGSRVNEIARYGYPKSVFALAKRDADGNQLVPSAFAIGPDGYHVLIWRNEFIDSMTCFRYEPPPVPNTYGDWQDVENVQSFTVYRPSTAPYFAGLVILALTGFLLSRFRRSAIGLFSLLLAFPALMVVVSSLLAEALAMLPAMFAIGWISAAVFGRSMAPKDKASDAGPVME